MTVAIVVGANDIPRSDEEGLLSSMQTLCQAIQEENPAATVIVSEILPRAKNRYIGARWTNIRMINDIAAAYNKTMKEVEKRLTWLKVVEVDCFHTREDSFGQKTINIRPYPTAKVTEGGSITFTCTYVNEFDACPSQALFEWFLNETQALLLTWENNQCVYGDGDKTLRYTCGTAQSMCQITLTLTQVKMSQHDDLWICAIGGIDIASRIFVKVPITKVDVTSPVSSHVIVSENSPSSFVCETSAGRPQATIQWYKQLGTNAAVPVQGGTITTTPSGESVITRSTLQYTPTRSDHDYRVYCTAYNIDESFTNTSNNKPQLYVQYAPDTGPVIEDQNSWSKFYVLDGKPQSLTCSIDGGRPLASLTWNCSGGAVQDQSSGNTTKQQVTWTASRAHDGKRCTCQASHPVWTNIRQVYVIIKALYPPTSPTFTVHSQPVTATISVIEGRSVSVTCRSTSNPPLVYSWTPRGSSPNGSNLTLTSVSTSDNGVEYTCTVTKTMIPTQGEPESQSNSTSFTLNVLYPPTITKLKNETAVENASFSKGCLVTPGNPYTTEVQWIKVKDNTVFNGSTLTIEKVPRYSAGTYMCTARNTMQQTGETAIDGTNSATFILDVYYSASITKFSINDTQGDGPFTYDENTTVTIACLVDSNPGSEITLSRDGLGRKHVTNSRHTNYTIYEASCLDAGMYSCTAKNQYNGNNNSTISRQLYFRCPPRSHDSVNNYTYFNALNESVTLNLTVTAFPEPTFRWYKQDREITMCISNITMGISKNSHQTILTLEQINQDDFGQYKVVVENPKGKLEHLLFVAAQEKPQRPTNVTIELVVHNSAVLHWVPGFNGGQEQTFVIEYWPSSQNGLMTIQQKSDTRDSICNITLTNLTPETEYNVQVYAGNSIGNSSKSKQVTFTTKKRVNKEEHTSLTAAAAGGGIAAAVITLAVGVLVIIMIRRRKKSTNTPKGEAVIYENTMIDRIVEYRTDEQVSVVRGIERTFSKETEIVIEREPPKLTESTIHICDLAEVVFSPDSETKRFAEEYQNFREGMTKEHNAALQNRSRNKYRDLYAYDDTRVVLDIWDDDSDTDYINACNIQGFKKPNAYIASQGPIKNNLNDFWRMVWQTNAVQIVMLNNIVEHGKEKSIRYWPEDGSEVYGRIKVTLAVRQTFSSFVIRTLMVNKEFEPPRQVQQFHFTAWPDKDVPAFCSSLVHFRSKVKAAASTCDGPVVVHDSAGIGRTGTYIAIDYLVEEAEELGYVDVVGCVTALREQRVNMVQKEKQYVFVHLSLVDILLLQTSVVSTLDFVESYTHLLKPVNGTRRIDAEFDLLWKLSPKVEENADNSDDPDAGQTVPQDAEYMPGYSEPGTRRYGEVIDAAFLPLFRYDNAMIIAKTPSEWTIEKFWNLVYHQQVHSIVMMNQEGVYWPGNNRTVTHGNITISNNGAEKKGSHYIVKLTMFNNGSERDIQLLVFGTWTRDKSVPDDPNHVLSALDIVGSNQKKTGNHPIVVHCMDGVEHSGLFCVIAALLDRTKIEQDVAISQVIQEMRDRRKNVIPTVEQFEFCHEVVCTFLQRFDSHSNLTFGGEGEKQNENGNVYESLDPALKKDWVYETLETHTASSAGYTDESRNVYESLDPALKKDWVYETLETHTDQRNQDKEEDYVNLKL